MALFLDSADVKEAERAMQMGFVAGVTTNPTLVARTGKPAYDVISELCSHVTIPLQLIEEMAEHKLSALAIEEFARAAAGQARA